MNWIHILSFFVVLLCTNCYLNDGNSLAGSYRLRVPMRPYTISEGKLSIKMCNLHEFGMELLPNEQIKFTGPNSTKMSCPNYYDNEYVNLFKKINSYKLYGRSLYINGEHAAFADRQEISNSLYGQWKLGLSYLEMRNGLHRIAFKGCNYNYFVYDISEDEPGYKQIKVRFVGKTKMFCQADNDEIFEKALTSAKTVKIKNPLSFDLYDSDGNLCAQGVPQRK